MEEQHPRRHREQNAWWWVMGPAVELVLCSAFRLRVAGAEHLPASGSAILAANHVSALDPIVISVIPYRAGRTIRFLTAAEFFDKPLVGWALKRYRQIPVRRGGADWEALRRTAAVIGDGTLAGIFPEGRVRHPGEPPLPGNKGAARVALAAGMPVVPVGVWGTQERFPRGGLRVRGDLRPSVAVVLRPPMGVGGDPRSRVDVRALTDRIMAEIGEAERKARAMTRP